MMILYNYCHNLAPRGEFRDICTDSVSPAAKQSFHEKTVSEEGALQEELFVHDHSRWRND